MPCYDSPVNTDLVEAVATSSWARQSRRKNVRVIDLGCGTGANATELAALGLRCVGITLSRQEAEECARRGIPVVVADLRMGIPFKSGSADAVVASHVVEHLPDPWVLINEARRVLNPEGRLFVALPNVVFWKQRLAFLAGRFRYTDTGLLDRTHLRFFDLYSAERLIEQGGFGIVRRRHAIWYPARKARWLPAGLARPIFSYMSRRFPNLLAYQFVFEARPTSA